MFIPEYISNSRYVQYLSALSAGLAPLIFTTYITWPSPSLILLTSDKSPINTTLSDEEASWVAAVLFLGMVPGSIIQGLLLDRIGPKKLLVLCSIVFLAAWILIGVGQSLALLIIGRVLGGVGSGMMISSVPIYVCEIASKDIRGKLSMIPSFASVIGSTIVFGIGPFVSYTTLAVICAIFPVILLLSILWAPDSPYYLVKKGREEEARKNLMRLNGRSTNEDLINESLEEIRETLKFDGEHKTPVELILNSNFRKSVLIVLGAKTITEFSGGYTINSYMQTIMVASQSNLSSQLSSVIYSSVQIPSVILLALLVDRLGRKILFSISSFGACCSLLGEGTYFYFQGKVNLESVSFLPITFLTLYKILVSFGLTHLPYLITGELFSSDTKRMGGLIFAFFTGVTSFLNAKLFSTVTRAWGIYTACWIFAGVCAIGILFGLLLIPETKGKSFRDIQNRLSPKPR